MLVSARSTDFRQRVFNRFSPPKKVFYSGKGVSTIFPMRFSVSSIDSGDIQLMRLNAA
jgi:hypothetical protein